MQMPSRRSGTSVLVVVAGLVLANPAPVLAQAEPVLPPAREGNIYDHKDHQPTKADIDRAQAAAGVHPQSSVPDSNVEKDVEELLKQTDAPDKQAEEQSKKDRNGDR